MDCGLRPGRCQAAALSALAAFSAVALSGCPEEPPEETPPTIVLSSSVGTSLEADGTATLELRVSAFSASQEPDNAPVSVSVDRGRIADASGIIDASEQSATLSLENGQATLSFQCPFRETGAANVEAANGVATARFTVNCIEPRGRFELRTTTADCESLTASGASSCRVGVNVEKVGGNRSFPEPDLTLNVEVTSAIVTDPNDTADDRVIAAEPNQPGDVTRSLSLTTDEDGAAEFFVYSTEFDLEQDLEVEVSATAPDTTELKETVVIEISEFQNRTRIDITPQGLSMAAGANEEFTLRARDENGDSAAAATVTVTVPEGAGATLAWLVDGVLTEDADEDAPGLQVTTGEDGEARVRFTAPEVTEATSIDIVARYRPAPRLPEATSSAAINVLPEGALLVNTTVSPSSIRADEGQTATLTVDVSRYVVTNGQPSVEPQNGVEVSFRVQPSDVDRIQFVEPGQPGPVVRLTRATLAEGDVSVVVAAQDERIRGRTQVQVVVADPADPALPPIERTLTIDVERAPILQSLVFQSASPPELGVVGSAYPSSSVVSFQVLDDLGQPLPNVLVRFDVNASSDPNASVVGEGFTDIQGVVSTVLAAGTQAGPISVVATALFNGRALVAESLPIAVSGGLPSFGNSYMTADRASVLQLAPFEAEVVAVLADRFTNRAPDNLVVQFRAESGNIDPVVTTADGTATAKFVMGAPGSAPASLLSASGESWSYGAVVPNTLILEQLGYGSCGDGQSRTTCDLIGLCGDAGGGSLEELYCPLSRDDQGEGCWTRLEAGVLMAYVGRSSVEALDYISADLEAQLSGDVVELLETIRDEGVLAYFSPLHAHHQDVRRLVDAYLENQHACGVRTSCLFGFGGASGIDFIAGDECHVAQGCLDFDPATLCPQDGLLSIMASTRGEEAFVDLNGNGRFDYTDTNGNNRHDPGEPVTERPGVAFEEVVVDMPEPFLDKNNSLEFDNYEGSVRLSAFEEYRLSDLFSDEDNSGTFGFPDPETGTTRHSNGAWDRDKQIFFTTHVVAVSPGAVFAGQPCAPQQIGTNVDCLATSETALCQEAMNTAFGVAAYAPGCGQISTLDRNGFFRLGFVVRDLNGNCPSPGFASALQVATEGPIEVVTDAPEVLDEGACGFDRAADASRPYAEVLPGLGSRMYVADVIAKCEGEEDERATFELNAGPDAVPFRVNFEVLCSQPENN